MRLLEGWDVKLLDKLPSQMDLVESVKTALFDAIIEGKITPNDKLSQIEIADALGVSRQPVIQALRILSEQGILVPHGKKSLTVATLNEKNLLKLLDVRMQLDCLGVRLAAQRVKDSSLIDEDHEIIEAINRLIFDSHLLIVNGEHLKLVRSDISFHKLLRALSGNEFIQSVLEPHLLHHNRLVSAMSINRHTKIWHQHKEILGAILQGNGKLAEQTMMEHINSAAAAIDWKRDTNG